MYYIDQSFILYSAKARIPRVPIFEWGHFDWSCKLLQRATPPTRLFLAVFLLACISVQ